MNDHLLGKRYRLSDRIAVGGMGEVWRGTDELLDRPVAVKLLSAAHATDEAFRARFRAEARYAASLSHPNIAQVFDYGETSSDEEAPSDLPSGGAYLVMELVAGEPLSAMIARQERLPAGRHAQDRAPGRPTRCPRRTRPASCIATSNRATCCYHRRHDEDH